MGNAPSRWELPSGFMGASETDASSIHGRSLSRSAVVGREMRMPLHSVVPMAHLESFITQDFIGAERVCARVQRRRWYKLNPWNISTHYVIAMLELRSKGWLKIGRRQGE